MSERILKALMQLFAIVARPDSDPQERRQVVESFLKEQLTKLLVNSYLKFYDDYYDDYRSKIRTPKDLAKRSVRVLIICAAINEELTQRQKMVVVIRLLEFIKAEGIISDLELEFVSTVADSFHIPMDEYRNLETFVLTAKQTIPQNEKILIIDANKEFYHSQVKHLQVDGLRGQIFVLFISSANMYIFLINKENELYLNGQLLNPAKIHFLNTGSSIRNSKIKPIYYGDIVSTYNIDKQKVKTVFEVSNLEYFFKNGKNGLHKMSFIERAGKLVGIMGASGAGKTTLLNVLNGSTVPTFGEVLINGINIHIEKEKIKGVIGYVSQDDLLMEDLTVFENLYFNAKLCFDNYNEFRINRIVLKLLKSLGLYEIKDMKVGSALNKNISGGQRKRLNIALELIREPAVLFLDEPTSGLSSRDSEHIMDLLKELALKGKLIFVVIHQPSSNIFKMFDRLIVLDQGGYLIYNGDPVDSIMYFKSRVQQADWSESECSLCGNVNPEQIFNIVESRVHDEYGNLTQTRKISPQEWNEMYIEYSSQIDNKKSMLVKKIPEITFRIPHKLRQFSIFVKRDILSKLANTQYILINLLEAPILAFLLSFIIKFFNVDANSETGYTFFENSNLPVYIFMSVIVSLFVGLTVSAEEIIKDRKILKREKFLNLSKGSYLMSKVAILFSLSAFQAISFVLVGNFVMEIQGMYWQYWLVLFSTWCCANMMGLNISDGFKTSVTIYILIPFLIIPQIILSGVLVSYDKLNPRISSPSSIPFYGEIITARWSYEALAVYTFKDNAYEKLFYELDKEMSIANFKKDFWIPKLDEKLTSVERNLHLPEKKSQVLADLLLLRNELKKEMSTKTSQRFKAIDSLYIDKINENTFAATRYYLEALKLFYRKHYNIANRKKDLYVSKREETKDGKETFKRLRLDNHNKKLEDFVLNSAEANKIVEYKSHLYQKVDPIFNDPESNFLKAHFYAPQKLIAGKSFDTFWVNIFVLWTQTLTLYISLYFGWLQKLLNFFEEFNFNRKQKKQISQRKKNRKRTLAALFKTRKKK